MSVVSFLVRWRFAVCSLQFAVLLSFPEKVANFHLIREKTILKRGTYAFSIFDMLITYVRYLFCYVAKMKGKMLA